MLIGLVGKPSAGKSTFFRAATLADAEIASYPFTTIKPNHGIGYVKIRDLAVDFGKHSNPREGYVKGDFRFVPIEMFDVAGLVEGASEGKGLGNQFLDDLTGVDAFIMVVDVSGETDAEGKQAEGYNPLGDINMIENELDLWYLGILKKVWKNLMRNMIVQKTDFAKAIGKQFSGLKVKEEDVRDVVLRGGFNVSNCFSWDDKELFRFSRALRRFTKPMIIAGNKIDRPNGKENFEKIKKEFDYITIPVFADGELSLRQADKYGVLDYISGEESFEVKKELSSEQEEALDKIRNVLKEFGSTGVQEVLNTCVFKLLDYIAVYPAGSKLQDSKGNVLPDCYLMKNGSTALDFAYKLHTDIGNGFIKAVHIKTKQTLGKDYKLKNGDGLEIMTR
ncbi:MAG: redox-regulated ATPase YchF [Candidatus Pacearchaeota archaeon]|nr:redox-regulated ATPase YchF [Candidatus Pacearchaeota archaeon]